MGTDEGSAGDARQAGGEPPVEEAAEYRALIRALLRQTPEERLEGLRRAAAFFDAARRV